MDEIILIKVSKKRSKGQSVGMINNPAQILKSQTKITADDTLFLYLYLSKKIWLVFFTESFAWQRIPGREFTNDIKVHFIFNEKVF